MDVPEHVDTRRPETHLASVRARTEADLIASIRRFRGSVPRTVFGVVEQDRSGRIVAWTRSAAAILGMTDDQLAGRTSLDPTWSSINENGAPLLGQDHPAMVTARTGRPTTGVLMGVRRDRSATMDYAWVLVDSFPTRLADGSAGTVTCFHEVEPHLRATLQLRHSEQMFRMITARLNEVIGLHALDGTWLWASPATLQVFGYAADDLIGSDVFDLIPSSHRRTAVSALEAVVTGRDPVTVTIPMMRRGGTPVWVEVVGQIITDPSGRPYQIQSCFRDVTDRITAQAERDTAVDAMTSILTTSPTAMVLVTPDGHITQSNAAMHHMLGIDDGTVVAGTGLSDLIHPDDRAQVRDERAAIATSRRPSMRYVARWVSASADHDLWVESLTVPIRDATGSITAVVEHLTDVTARRRADDELHRRASLDTVTGLLNRTAFVDAVRRAMDAPVDADTRVALVFLDLDGFKDVNDTWGHPTGDRLLGAVADRLSAAVGTNGWVARYGGDEFAVAYPCRREDLTALTDRIAAVFDHPLDLDGAHLTIAASMGWSWGEKTDLMTLVRDADRHMYVDKRRRRAAKGQRTTSNTCF